MRKSGGIRWVYVVALASMASYACSGERDGKGDGDGGGDNPGDGGAVDAEAGTLDGGLDGALQGDAGNLGDAYVPIACGQEACGIGQRCDTARMRCVDNACADLSCGANEECTPAAGGGHVCTSIACASDLSCSEARYCDGTKCVDDACEPEVQRCDGNQVFQCASNGARDEPRFSCAGGAYFASSCREAASGTVGCSCEDDWDCPSFTACIAGTCQGTGVPPTCTLPARPFQEVLPTLEFRWGGESKSSSNATGKPFPNYAQVVMTPVVANLDDDNGDGLINELDFPEIIFIAYAGSGNAVHHSGAVRAIHGGGPKRGEDYFALCGEKHWLEGDDASLATCATDEGLARPGGGLAVGDLDYDGVPEIAVPTERGTLQILDNRGRVITESEKEFIAQGDLAPDNDAWKYPQVALANLDNVGLAEAMVGNRVFVFEKPQDGVIQVRDVFVGQLAAEGTNDRHFGPTVCPANLIDADPSDQDVSQEIVVGTVLYALPTPPAGVTRVADCPVGDTSDFCEEHLTVVWDARAVPANTGAMSIPTVDGYCAVADVLGADTAAAPGPENPLDRAAEVILVSDGRVLVLRASDGTLLRKFDVQPGQRGGAPNVDDFDGDGFPEVAMASSGFYTVIDLQEPEPSFCPAWTANLGATTPAPGSNPARMPGGACTDNAQCSAGSVCNTTIGSCVCLHNGWKRATEDDSSKATSSSVFDFNGDGAAEVVYGDECYFRVYDGSSGDIRLAIPSVSRTVLENPVVADVDNDGNAEIVFVNNNETIQCGDGTNQTPLPLQNPDGTTVAPSALPNGIQVWGDASDTWVSARRIWNQHAYHVTNVTEGGTIPMREPESFRPYGNRLYNTYRSQPRAFGVAPDLALVEMQVSSPGVACGQLSSQLSIVVLVKNLGDLRVGPGVAITFHGAFAGGNMALRGQDGMPLRHTLATSLEPGASVLIEVPYRAEDNANMVPTRIAAVVDEAAAERECREDNNRVEQDVSGGAQLADLRLELGAPSGPCATTKVAVLVHNDGSLPAENVLVRLFAGDPSAGGNAIGEATVVGPITPGSSASVDVMLDNLGRDITVWGIADPLDAIAECNNANNVDEGPAVPCGPFYL